MMQVFCKFGSIQFDPIAVVGRNHDLVLHARVACYEPAWCDAPGRPGPGYPGTATPGF